MKYQTKCFKVSDAKICPNCKNHKIVKNGSTKSKKQQYLCKSCGKRFLDYYTYNAYHEKINSEIIYFTKEGLGIRSTARVLRISTTTLLKRIILIADKIPRPFISKDKIYEVDELRTYVKDKSKLIWIVYALERETKRIVSFNVGARTHKTLQVVLTSLELSETKHIYTDGFKNYKYLIQKKIHKVIRFGTNSIERKNLNLRIHLKRLNRRTICFSKSLVLLSAVLKIYFWDEQHLNIREVWI